MSLKDFAEDFAKEEKVKKELKEKNFLDPTENEDFKSFFNWKDQDTLTKFRRFMLDLVYLEYGQLNRTKQPRAGLDTGKVDHLKEIFKKEGMKYPPFIVYQNNIPYLEAGFHRTEAKKKEEKIPFIVVSEPYYFDESGNLQKLTPEIITLPDGETISTNPAECFSVFTRAATNPRSVSEPMSIESWGLSLHKAFEADRTMCGKNPSGSIPTSVDSKSWKQVMTLPGLGEYASTPTVQGRILASWRRNETNGGADTKRTITEDTILDDLRSLNWSTGIEVVKDSVKRKPFLRHIDEANKAYILISYDDGNNLDFNLSKMYNEFRNETLKQDRILALLRIYKCPGSLSTLNKKRWLLINGAASEYNKNVNVLRRFIGIGTEGKDEVSSDVMPLIEEIFMMPQLEDPKDSGIHVVWDVKQQKFIKKQKQKSSVAA